MIYLNSSSRILTAILTGINIFGLMNPHKQGLVVLLTGIFVEGHKRLRAIVRASIKNINVSHNQILYSCMKTIPNIHIKQSIFSILKLNFKGMFVTLLITSLFEGLEGVSDIKLPEFVCLSCFRELVCDF
jgi:hypothetical protein